MAELKTLISALPEAEEIKDDYYLITGSKADGTKRTVLRDLINQQMNETENGSLTTAEKTIAGAINELVLRAERDDTRQEETEALIGSDELVTRASSLTGAINEIYTLLASSGVDADLDSTTVFTNNGNTITKTFSDNSKVITNITTSGTSTVITESSYDAEGVITKTIVTTIAANGTITEEVATA